MEKTEVDIKDTIKFSKVRMTGPTNESDPRIQLTAHVEGMRIHVFTMHESKWGKSKEKFQEDMKHIQKFIENENMTRQEAKNLRDHMMKIE